MATTYSFDITSDFSASELDHALDQARREITNRYDFKGTAARVDYTDETKQSLTIEGDNEYHLDAILDMLRSKLAKRGLSQKIVDTSQKREQPGTVIRQTVPFVRGLDKEKAKKITNLLRDTAPKVKTQIQGESVRVSSAKKDELQAAMSLLKEQDFEFPILFENFR